MSWGDIVLREQHRYCPNGCKDQTTGLLFQSRSNLLGGQVPPGCNFGYDVECHIGIETFLHHKQIKEIRTELQSRGIIISESEVTYLKNRFLNHVECVHFAYADQLRNYLDGNGGHIAHTDATNDKGKGRTFAVLEGESGWVLAAGRIETENFEDMTPILQKSIDNFSMPLAFVRDMGKAMHKSIEEVTKGLDIPELVCHFHVGKDIGNDILSNGHDVLMKLFRNKKIKKALQFRVLLKTVQVTLKMKMCKMLYLSG
jgi:hypothetical protein